MRAVFVGGCPRSGTTLLGTMLGTHPDTLAVPESHFKVDALRFDEVRREPLDVAQAMAQVRRYRDYLGWEQPPDLPRPEEGITAYTDLLEWLVRRYGAAVGKPAPKLWIDHTPDNVRFASTLFEMFRDAKLIHIVRDGRAVAASVMPLQWGPNRIEPAALYWIQHVGQGLAAEVCWGPSRVMRVRYEDLVLRPEVTLPKLCAFIDIDYRPEMLNADGFTVPRHMRTPFPLIGKPADPSRIDGWRTALTPRQIERFERRVDEFLRYFGYPLLYGIKARPPSRRERVAAVFEEVRRQAPAAAAHYWQRMIGRGGRRFVSP